MRNVSLEEGEYYHVFNRGVEKRNIFLDTADLKRFLESIEKFNTTRPIGSLHENRARERHSVAAIAGGSLASKLDTGSQALVELVCYCLNPNHFHLILKQAQASGIQKYMQRLGTGYTNYFNEKYKRSGSLFQGTYKAVHIESNEQLLHTSAYVNLNNQIGSLAPKLSKSSWEEYMISSGPASKGICTKGIILDQFSSVAKYRVFALESSEDIAQRKEGERQSKSSVPDFGSLAPKMKT